MVTMGVGIGADGVSCGSVGEEGGVSTEGVSAEGVDAHGVICGCIGAEGVSAEGVSADGVGVIRMGVGIGADGVGCSGIGAEGVNARREGADVSGVAMLVQKESLSLQRELKQVVLVQTELIALASHGARGLKIPKREPNGTGSFSWVSCCWPLLLASF